MYIVNYKMEFRTRPSKLDVQNKSFDLLAEGFTLRTPEEAEDYARTKELKEKNNVHKRTVV